MFARQLATVSRALMSSPMTYMAPLSAAAFCSWKPIVPKYRYKVNEKSFHMAHPTWDLEDVANVKQIHRKPEGVRDRLAYFAIKALRKSFDFVTGYNPKTADENNYMARFIFLEVIAGVPGMIGGMFRHMRSIVTMREDKGWIHHLLEEAENERMHLFVFLDLRNPGKLLRAGLIVSQAAFILAYSLLYLLSSKTAHRFVGYLEEEAIKTYSYCIQQINEGKLPKWDTIKAPHSAIEYWSLRENSMFKDVIMNVRADDVMHREVNHRLADLKGNDLMSSTTVTPEDVANAMGEAKGKVS